MAVNLKKFRKINIDDQTYYWRAAPDQWMIKLIITKSGDNTYPFLETYFDQRMIKLAGETEPQPITPKLVRETILSGLAQGWTPDVKSRQVFRLEHLN